MTEKKRPTSPHIQIYKWTISSFTSIMHRLTGVSLYASIVAISWYVVYYTYQINISHSSSYIDESCDCPIKAFMDKVFIAAAIALTFSLYYHFCNGIRHLFWDIGKGFDKDTARNNGFLVISLAAIFTALTIGAVLIFKIIIIK